ncbi:MAG: hypothetical protein WD029_01200, partial [Microthrixaceae bacterium]
MSGYQSVTLFRSMSGSVSVAAANRRSFVFCVVSVLIVFSGLVSCSGSGEEDGSTSTTVIPAATAATDGSSTTEAAVDVGVNVKVASSAAGEVLSDGQGHVFYIFTPDGTGAATCVDACAGAWPPVLTEGGVVADAAVSG